MIAAIVSLLLDLSHCARWQATPRGARCADVRLDAPTCLVTGWHAFGVQRINVCTRGCGAEGPVS
jgi:hypothetical protein